MDNEVNNKKDKSFKNKISVGAEVFQYIKSVSSNNKEDQINGSINLLRCLFNHKENEADYSYSLKRLIRGVGSSTTQCRAGFFTSLVGFLHFSPDVNLNSEKILDLATKELCVGKEITNKDDNDAISGLILVCGALIRSGNLKTTNFKVISRITSILMNSSKHKAYHEVLAVKFIVEMLQSISEEQFETSVLSIIKEEIKNCDGIYSLPIMYVLIEIQKNFASLKTKHEIFFKPLINVKSFEALSNCLFNNSTVIIMKSVIEGISMYLANNKDLENFWKKCIEPRLVNLTKNMEIHFVKIATNILVNSTEQISFLLSKNFVKSIVNGVKSIKVNETKNKSIYNDFFKALVIYCNKKEIKSETKCQIIQKLILYPGIVNIEQYTGQKIINQIISKCDENSIITLYEIYKQIFLNRVLKNTEDVSIQWLQSERTHAGFMMQYLMNQKIVQCSYKWITQELNIIMTLAFFYTNNSLEIVKKKDINELLIDDELADQMKNIFFRSLQNKFATLKNEKKILLHLVNSCNRVLTKKNYNEYFRFLISEKVRNTWKEMFIEIEKLNSFNLKSKTLNTQLDYVFNILLMHMGLQLFKNAEMAETAITDLEKCMLKSKENIGNNKETLDIIQSKNKFVEPEWIEVVIDLFLHLLSQNSNCLRNIVNSVFPHLCEFLTLSSVHQILEIFVMQNGFNPLTDDNTISVNDDEDDESEVKSDNGSDNTTSDTNESSSIGEDILEEPTETEKLRNVLSLALTKNELDCDGNSIDLDDLSEEEGRKLDEVLAEAFKMRKKSDKVIKSSKEYHTEFTTLMHFRIRVLDLLDIYIQHKPNLLIILEIVITLFNSLVNCTTASLIPLEAKIEKILNKITNLKTISNGNTSDLNLFTYFENILHEKSKGQKNESYDKIRSRCIIFLIHVNNSILNNTLNKKSFETKIVNELNNGMKDFLKFRNPNISFILFKHLFKTSWEGVWNVANTAVDNGLSLSVRTYKRIQILELLDLLYKNNQLLNQNEKFAKKYFNLIEVKLADHLKSLVSHDEVSSKEFSSLIHSFINAINFHKKKNFKIAVNENILCEHIQEIRKKITLISTNDYLKFCSNYNLTAVSNDEIDTSEDVTHKEMIKKKRKQSNVSPAVQKQKKKKI